MYKGKKTRRFMRYLRRTLKQKLYAMAMLAIGVLSTMLLEGEATVLVLIACLAVPMFFSRRTDWLV